MTIRARFSAAIMLGGFCATLAAAGGVLSLTRHHLITQALKRPGMIIDPVMKVAEESVVSRDPMLLMSHLNYLLRSRPELVSARVRRDGDWVPVRRPTNAPAPASGQLIRLRRTIRTRIPYEASEGITVEMRFSQEALLRDYMEVVGKSTRAAVLVVSLVCLFGLPLAIWSANRYLSAIAQLEAGIGRMSAGEPVRPVPVKRRDEMGRLIGKFNRMSSKLADLDQMKKDFVSSITHELRSPLAAIQSFARMLRRNPKLDDLGRAQIQRIERSAERLSRFVDQLLESARIERGMLELKTERVDIAELIRDTVLFYQPRARELEIALGVELAAPELPGEADAERISQILTNLLGNALKFTPRKGSVTVYGRTALLNGRGAIEIGVIDTGIGIAPEDHDKLFRPFARISNPLKPTGTGLGLSIAKTLAEMHGGTLAVKSKPGAGSCFYFIFPVEQGAAKEAA